MPAFAPPLATETTCVMAGPCSHRSRKVGNGWPGVVVSGDYASRRRYPEKPGERADCLEPWKEMNAREKKLKSWGRMRVAGTHQPEELVPTNLGLIGAASFV